MRRLFLSVVFVTFFLSNWWQNGDIVHRGDSQKNIIT